MGLLIPARKYKLGDGITRWNDLEFATTGDGYGTHQVGYLTCTTPANEPTKQVDLTDFTLSGHCRFIIIFINGNSAVNPTLNIGGTGDVPLRYNNLTINTTNTWDPTEEIDLYYDGDSFN